MNDKLKITLDTNLLNQEEKNTRTETTVNTADLDKFRIVGKITREIGTGDDAKHSIIWTTIRWCFIIASIITAVLFIFLGVAYYQNNTSEINELKKFVITTWSIFTPIITLALGYAFGKDYK